MKKGSQKDAFKSFNQEYCDAIVETLVDGLGSVDTCATELLLNTLNRVTNERDGALLQFEPDEKGRGRMPSFEVPGARVGYIAKRFTPRASYIGHLLLSDSMKEKTSFILSRDNIRVASIGGAAGSDFVGLLSWLAFLRTKEDSESNFEGLPVINCTVYEYERGWKESVDLLAEVINSRHSNNAPESKHNLEFKYANVLEEVEEASPNAELFAEASTYDLFFFFYVLVENSKGMSATSFAFLRNLFGLARPGAIFIFMDSSFKLWPSISAIASEFWGAEFITSISPKSKNFGNTLVLVNHK